MVWSWFTWSVLFTSSVPGALWELPRTFKVIEAKASQSTVELLRNSGASIQGTVMNPPPHLPFLAIRRFSVEWVWLSIRKPPKQEFFYVPLFYKGCVQFGPVFQEV